MTTTPDYSAEMTQAIADRAARARTWHHRLRHDLLPWCWDHTPFPIRVVLIILGFVLLIPSADNWWGG